MRNDCKVRDLPFLGVGPVSRNVTDAAIIAAYRCGTRVMLIPSRSQVDAERFGGGYLGWTTSEFAEHVRARDPQGLIMVCRDHGGPWQHPSEAGITDEMEALESCLDSYRSDIEAGYAILHLDTSVEHAGEAVFEDAARRLITLYERCTQLAVRTGSDVVYEIGFEPQGVEANDPELFATQLNQVCAEIVGRGLGGPAFVVAQTGTKVRELANTGAFVRPESRDSVTAVIGKLAGTCHERGARLKAHNCDYLTPLVVHDLTRAGVHSANVAPEFGTAETRAVLRLLHEFQLGRAAESFLELAFASHKWVKWMAPDTSATDYQRAVIAGHYVFETERFHEIREELEFELTRRRLPSLADQLIAELSLLIERYLLAGASRWYAAAEPQLQAR